MDRKDHLIQLIAGKTVLYVASKNADYIRLSQEMNIVKEHAAQCDCIVSSQMGYASRLKDIFLQLAKTDTTKYDVVFVGFMSQLILPFWFWKFRENLVIQDFFLSIYDTLTNDRKKVKPGSLAGRFLHWVDQFSFRHSDWIVCDTAAHGTWFQKEFGLNPDRMLPLDLEADHSVYYPRPQKKPVHWQDKFLVVYFGSILPVQGVETVLAAARQLESRPNIHFLLIGPVQAQGGNVTVIPWLNQQELAEHISWADLCLAGHFARDIRKADHTVPGKAYIYEVMKKPMILGDSQANRDRFLPDADHVFVPRGDAAALAEAIRKKANHVQ